MNRFVLDSCAVIAFLYGEQGKDKVKDILSGENEIYMHSLSILEVYYDAVRRIESNRANVFLNWIFNESPVRVLEIPLFWQPQNYTKQK